MERQRNREVMKWIKTEEKLPPYRQWVFVWYHCEACEKKEYCPIIGGRHPHYGAWVCSYCKGVDLGYGSDRMKKDHWLADKDPAYWSEIEPPL